MRPVVADTGPLHYLVLIGHIDLIPALFGPGLWLRVVQAPALETEPILPRLDRGLLPCVLRRITICIYSVRYEWDAAKDLLNQEKHGVSFDVAMLVFEDDKCLIQPDRVDEETAELRWHAIGTVQLEPGFDAVLLVVHVYREDHNGEEIIRVISARAASKQDIRRYQEQEVE